MALLSAPAVALLERLDALTTAARAEGRSAWLRPELSPEESRALGELRRERLVEEQVRGAGLHDSRWIARRRESLIITHRHRPDDLERWRVWERVDALNVARGRLFERAARSRETLRGFIREGGGYLGVSWGKDSVICAHLLHEIERDEGYRYPVVWVRVRLWENPDCVLVRDAFLARWPLVAYEEIEVDEDPTLPVGWNVGGDSVLAGFREAARRHGDRHVSGVRAAESSTRRLAMAHHGETSARSCRPIGWWSTDQVFAYLSAHDLPVHPAYAYTMCGTFDRNRLRCDALGGETGHGHGRAGWERTYYDDVLRAAGAASHYGR